MYECSRLIVVSIGTTWASGTAVMTDLVGNDPRKLLVAMAQRIDGNSSSEV